ncbi:hypothetical protein D3C80_1351270 [compost metagenome]
MGADADGEGLDRAPLVLAQGGQIPFHVYARNDAARLDQAKRQTARQAGQGAAVHRLTQATQLAQGAARLGRQPGLDAPLRPFTRRNRAEVAQQPHARGEGIVVEDAGRQSALPQHVAAV